MMESCIGVMTFPVLPQRDQQTLTSITLYWGNRKTHIGINIRDPKSHHGPSDGVGPSEQTKSWPMANQLWVRKKLLHFPDPSKTLIPPSQDRKSKTVSHSKDLAKISFIHKYLNDSQGVVTVKSPLNSLVFCRNEMTLGGRQCSAMNSTMQ